MSISLPGQIETESKQPVENFLLDRVATADSRLVSEVLCTTDCVVLPQYFMSANSQHLQDTLSNVLQLEFTDIFFIITSDVRL